MCEYAGVSNPLISTKLAQMKKTSLFLRLKCVAWLSTIVLVSCGDNKTSKPADASNSTAAPKTEAKNACALITEADAKTILGEAIKPGMQTNTMCQYISGSDELSKAGESVSLTLHQNAGSEFDKYVTDTEASTSVRTEPVAGIGEKAAWADGSLIVKQGNDLLVIIVGKKLDKEKHIAEAKSLAASIISRM
jgi:hypothetical protein